MIQLHYTAQDLFENKLLRETASIMMMLWAKHDWHCLIYHWDYEFPIKLIKYVVKYDCFIKMKENEWNGEVYDWLDGREFVNKDETVSVISFSEWKDENFTDPLEYDWYVYIPSDIKYWWLNWKQLQVFIDKGCDIVSIEDYRKIMETIEENDFIYSDEQ